MWQLWRAVTRVSRVSHHCVDISIVTIVWNYTDLTLSLMHIDRLYSSIWGFVIHIDQQKKRTWNTSSDAAEGCLTSLVFWYDEDNTEQARLASAGGHYRCMSPSISYPIKMRQWQKWPGCDLDPWWHLHPDSALSRLSGHILSNREGGEKTARYS